MPSTTPTTPFPDEAALLDSIERWLVREVRPVAASLEHDDIYPTELVAQMIELGLFGATISPEYGGLGLPASTYARIVTLISETWMSLTGIFNSHLLMAAIVEKFGTDAQKSLWLPLFAAGQIRGSLGLTEPDTGTDLGAIRTRARRTEHGTYVIDGTKTWISNGIEGGAVALLARTDPDPSSRHRGLSMFIIAKADPQTGEPTAGYRTGRKIEKLGYKGIDSAELIFENVEIDAERHLVGGAEGQGFYMAVGGLELGRINVAARAVGLARRAMHEAVAYSQHRRTFGKPICEHQAIQLKLGEMAAKVRASELLVADAAAAYDRGDRCDMEAGMAKYFASETAVEVTLEAMRIFGGYGYSKEYPIERLYRDAPLMCIGEGTNEMQRIIIARQLVARNPI
jgi:alkylation response protein AidB-like acyl-CoA dehydrogenase